MGHREHAMFMVGCWAIWEHRNKVVFDTREVDVRGIIRRINDVTAEMEGGGCARERKEDEGLGRRTKEGGRAWEAPPAEYVKINVDAGITEGVGISIGVVCRDEMGVVRWGISQVQRQQWDSQMSEAVAIMEGISEAARRGHQDCGGERLFASHRKVEEEGNGAEHVFSRDSRHFNSM